MNKYLEKIAEKHKGIDEKEVLKRSLKTTATSFSGSTLIGGLGAAGGAAIAARSPGFRKALTAAGRGIKKVLPKAMKSSKAKTGGAIAGGAVVGKEVGELTGDFIGIHHGTREAMKEGKNK